MTGPHLGDDLESYALGLLDDREAKAAELHAAVCPTCARDLATARRTVAALTDALPAVEPPARLERRLRAAVRAPRRSNAGLIAAAVAGLAILGLGANDLQLRERGAAADVALATIAGSHFNHVTATSQPGSGVTVKILYARDGAWLFAIATGTDRGALHVVARDGGHDVDLGGLVAAGTSASLLIRPASRVRSVVIEDGGRDVATATLVY